MSRLALGAVKGLILPGSGGGQAYAERTSSTSALGPSAADIPSLTISPVPDSTQMLLVMHLPLLTKDATANWVLSYITDSSTIAVGRAAFQATSSAFGTANVFALITGLTPGQAVTYKGRIQCGGGAVTVSAASDYRPFIAALRA